MTISSPTFQRLQTGVTSADDLRVRNPVNAALAWLSGDLVTQLNTHFGAVSQSISAHIAGLAAFRAHKNGVNQDSISAGGNILTWGTEAFDIGGFFASDTWTPPPGKHRISVAVQVNALNAVDNELLTLTLTKNGAGEAITIQPRAGTSVQTVQLTALVAANGTDAFRVNIAKAGAGVGTVLGTSTITYFCGEAV